MSQLRVIVVEDQAPAREHLVDIVSRTANVEVAAVCADGVAAIRAIRTVPADVVLLDIHMPECDGFQVIEAIGADRMPAVVFITAYDDHAVRAFDVRAVDYLMKPYSVRRVERALATAREHVQVRRVAAMANELAGFTATQVSAAIVQADEDCLTVRQRGQMVFVRPHEIEIVVAKRNDVLLYTRRDEFRCRATLTDIHRRLGDGFMKVHRSVLVNFSAVHPVVFTRGGVTRLRVGDGRDVRISRAFRGDVERRLRSSAHLLKETSR